MSELHQLSAREIADGVRSKKFTARDVAASSLNAIKRTNGKLNAYLTVLEQEALAIADAVDAKIKAGKPVGKLAGVPIALKDNLMLTGAKTTCASKILGNYIAPYDAFVVKRLKDEDAVFVGKTNLDEFAMGSSTENSAFGPTRNPWDTARIPGGSSGGSAAAVATRTVPIALGSDTGGSIRQPASLCGVLGLKPTYGRVSRYGVIAFASSLDQIGPFTHTAQDMALVMSVISGKDPADSTSVDEPVPDFSAEAAKSIKGLKIGIPNEYFIEGVDPEVTKAVNAAAETMKKLGAEVKKISLPNSGAALAVYYILAPSEASSNLARFDGMRYGFRSPGASNLIEQYAIDRRDGFGPEVTRRIMIGTYALSSGYYDAYYAKAQKVRTLIKRDFDTAFKDVDLILTPVSPTPAFKLGEKVGDPLTMYLSDIFTIPCNLAGIPGISVPCGFSSENLPIGVQFYADLFKDDLLIRAAAAYLNETGFHRKTPAVT
ncbi:MAG: Asp-tRNA(Asn)/Glu-tRNA(Gln) amidotransferase subunit GatA [Elusimicrobia bacterium]|nr:Asp-tRNA(Asn)/Glu-tRNA(Gln) amidotransferase subunit GatA [Elusimicrobiota bacterium]